MSDRPISFFNPAHVAPESEPGKKNIGDKIAAAKALAAKRRAAVPTDQYVEFNSIDELIAVIKE